MERPLPRRHPRATGAATRASARDFAARLAGSSDLFDRRARRPWASVNFVAAHDGFTLADIVSYAERHNEANGEDNNDGHGDNYSANWGVEGPTDDPAILDTRARLQRAMLATAVPVAGHADAAGRRRVRPHPAAATTTPTARTTRSRGSTGSQAEGARAGSSSASPRA